MKTIDKLVNKGYFKDRIEALSFTVISTGLLIGSMLNFLS